MKWRSDLKEMGAMFKNAVAPDVFAKTPSFPKADTALTHLTQSMKAVAQTLKERPDARPELLPLPRYGAATVMVVSGRVRWLAYDPSRKQDVEVRITHGSVRGEKRYVVEVGGRQYLCDRYDDKDDAKRLLPHVYSILEQYRERRPVVAVKNTVAPQQTAHEIPWAKEWTLEELQSKGTEIKTQWEVITDELAPLLHTVDIMPSCDEPGDWYDQDEIARMRNLKVACPEALTEQVMIKLVPAFGCCNPQKHQHGAQLPPTGCLMRWHTRTGLRPLVDYVVDQAGQFWRVYPGSPGTIYLVLTPEPVINHNPNR